MDGTTVYAVVGVDEGGGSPYVVEVFTERWRAELLARQLGCWACEATLRVGDGGVRG